MAGTSPLHDAWSLYAENWRYFAFSSGLGVVEAIVCFWCWQQCFAIASLIVFPLLLILLSLQRTYLAIYLGSKANVSGNPPTLLAAMFTKMQNVLRFTVWPEDFYLIQIVANQQVTGLAALDEPSDLHRR